MPDLFGETDPPPPATPPPATFSEDPPAPPAPPRAAAYVVLARKYRPARFDDLLGQEALVRTLRNAFAADRVAQAFLFTGIRGTGKTTTARIIARALNCTGPDGTGGPTADPCGACADCRAILEDRHQDVIELDAASNNSVDDARELRDIARFRPMQGRYKVFTLDECHMLSSNAWNALLKVLEEPPPYLKFVFATTELRKVPVTVLSRCQRFDLRRIPHATLSHHYAHVLTQEGVSAEPEAIAAIARAAEGSVRDGLSLLDQAIALAGGGPITAALVGDMLGLADRGLMLALLEHVLAGRAAEAMAAMDQAAARGADPVAVLRDLLDLTHTLTRFRINPDLANSPALTELERTLGAPLAAKLSMPVLARAFQMLLKGVAEAEHAPDRQAAAEMVLVRLCYAADLPPPAELVRRLTESGAPPPAAASPGPSGGGMRASVNGPPAMEAAPAAAPRLASFRDVVALAAASREPLLHAHLLHDVRPVRFAPPVIEINPGASAPRDLAARLSRLLLDATGARWTVALSMQAGEATLAERSAAADAARRQGALEHPLVQAIMATFPGATLEEVRDAGTDAYGLAPEPDAAAEGPGFDTQDFAPPDAVPADEMPEPEDQDP